MLVSSFKHINERSRVSFIMYGEKGVRYTLVASTTSSAYTMAIFLGCQRISVIDDIFNIGNIETTGLEKLVFLNLQPHP